MTTMRTVRVSQLTGGSPEGWLEDVQKVIERLSVLRERLSVLRGRQLSPAPALAIAVVAGLLAASLLTAVLEAVFTVDWWTALLYMGVFFAAGIYTYKRISPQGTHFAVTGGRRFLEESGTLDVIEAARDLSAKVSPRGR